MMRRAFFPLLLCNLYATGVAVIAEDQAVLTRRETPAGMDLAPAALTRSLRAAGSNAVSVVVPETIAAIQALGPAATSKQVAAVVYAAVRVTPDSALDIVRAAVKLSPEAAPEIAAAAARAIPNPWKEVRYQKGGQNQPPPQQAPQPPLHLPPQPPGPKEPDFKSPPVDQSLLEPVEEVFDPAAPGDPMSFAEAIVQTAVESGGNLADVQRSVDGALFGDPGQLFNKVGGARGISGVGDAGNSNYANEPHDPGDPGDPGARRRLTAPRTPNPQAVSR